MHSGRLEAFSDGVIAILITIMVLQLVPPRGTGLASLLPLAPVFLSYLLSFVYLAIYWNNHHHLMQVVERVDGRVLWANMHLLFWLSLVPFATAWSGENPAASWPTALYGVTFFFAAVAYFLLTRALLALHGHDSLLATAIGRDVKGKVSLLIYAAAIPLAFWRTWAADALYVLVAIIWLVPDPRIEEQVTQSETR